MDDETPRFSTFYIHVQRTFDSLGPRVSERFGLVPSEQIERGWYYSLLSEELLRALERAKPPTLGEAVVHNNLKPGMIVSHYGLFYCRGVGQYLSDKRRELPDMYVKLDDLRSGLRAFSTLDPVHFTATSSSSVFKGGQRLFTVSIVGRVESKQIHLKLIAAGLLVPDLFGDGPSVRMPAWSTLGEIRAEQIAAFAAAANEPRPLKNALSELIKIPEHDIKHAFAELIGEPFVHLDWPGETSDLYSSRVTVEGQSIAASFLLKGPSRFHPMKHQDLGKVGDQIVRLFNDPSDLYVLQHCHEVTPPVRAAMRAFANQIGRARMFCVIDGPDTLRILRATAKLGFKPTEKSRKANEQLE